MKKILGLLVGIILIGAIFTIVVMQNKVEERKDNNILVVGLDDSFPPMGFRNDENEIVGFDIDIAKAVAEKLNMEIKFQPISWAAKEQELDSGNIDCIWNGFAYNEERAEGMTLSNPYISSENIFVLKENSTAKNQDELIGKKIGVQGGSIQEQDLEKVAFGKNVEIIQYSDNLTAFMDLETGGIDAIYCSNIIGNYLIKSKNKNYETISSYGISEKNVDVVAFKKGNTQLKEKIDNALIELNNEGKLEEISKNWFGENLIIIGE